MTALKPKGVYFYPDCPHTQPPKSKILICVGKNLLLFLTINSEARAYWRCFQTINNTRLQCLNHDSVVRIDSTIMLQEDELANLRYREMLPNDIVIAIRNKALSCPTLSGKVKRVFETEFV